MQKDVIFITALTQSDVEDAGLARQSCDLKDYLDFSLKTWRWWCKKNDIDLYVFSQSDISVVEMGPCWQRWDAHNILKREGIQYRRVAIVDADTMVRWDCPNFLNFYRGNYCGVTCECDHWVYKSLKQFQHHFPELCRYRPNPCELFSCKTLWR